MGFGRVTRLPFNEGFVALANGTASLTVERVAGESAITSAQATSPLKLLTPRSRGASAWAFLSNFGGGVVAGDETSLTIKVGQGAACFFSTQASTKVYRNPHGRPCGHRTSATIFDGGLLVYAPDPVQAFADSAYVQRQEFHLAAGAGLVLLDWLSAGRSECGERWAFRRYQSRNDIFVNGERRVLDSLRLDSTGSQIASAHRMGRYQCLAMLLLAGPSLVAEAGRMLATVAELPVPRRGSLVTSASPIAEGVLLRVAGDTVELVRHELHRHLAFLAERLGDDPFARKW